MEFELKFKVIGVIVRICDSAKRRVGVLTLVRNVALFQLPVLRSPLPPLIVRKIQVPLIFV